MKRPEPLVGMVKKFYVSLTDYLVWACLNALRSRLKEIRQSFELIDC